MRERGEIRLARYELDAEDAVTEEVDRYWVQHRVRVGLDARWRMVRAYAVVRDARIFGQSGQLEGGGTDLHQGFLEVEGDPGWLRVGRQEIHYAAGRLVGARPWSPGQAFDAIRGHLDLGEASIDAFGAWVTPPVATEDLNVVGRLLFGLELREVVDAALVLELEAYYQYDDRFDLGGRGLLGELGGSLPAPTVADRRHEGTFGARAHGVAEGFNYDVELFGQVGERFDEDLHLAFAGRGWLSYRFGGPLGLGVRGGGSAGTGQTRDGDISTFGFHYGTNHGPYGIIDYAGLSNMVDGFLRLFLAPPGSKLRGYVEGHAFSLVEPGGPWRAQDGRLIAQTRAVDDAFLGGELDLVATYRPDPSLTLELGYAIYFPGPAAESQGVDDVSQFLYLSVEAQLP